MKTSLFRYLGSHFEIVSQQLGLGTEEVGMVEGGIHEPLELYHEKNDKKMFFKGPEDRLATVLEENNLRGDSEFCGQCLLKFMVGLLIQLSRWVTYENRCK